MSGTKRKKYKIIVTRNQTESTVINVSAANENAAKKVALELAGDPQSELDWNLDEGNYSEAYVTNIEEKV